MPKKSCRHRTTTSGGCRKSSTTTCSVWDYHLKFSLLTSVGCCPLVPLWESFQLASDRTRGSGAHVFTTRGAGRARTKAEGDRVWRHLGSSRGKGRTVRRSQTVWPPTASKSSARTAGYCTAIIRDGASVCGMSVHRVAGPECIPRGGLVGIAGEWYRVTFDERNPQP